MPPWAHVQVKGGQDAKLGFLIFQVVHLSSALYICSTVIRTLRSNSQISDTDINNLAQSGEASLYRSWWYVWLGSSDSALPSLGLFYCAVGLWPKLHSRTIAGCRN